MEYTDCNFDGKDDHIILTDANGDKKKIKLDSIKNVFILKESKTSPILWYHKLLMGIFLTGFIIFTIYKSLTFLDSGALDAYPTLSKVLFYLVLIYTILSLIAISLMVVFGISGDTKFLSYYVLKIIKTRRRKYFVIKTSRKEFKTVILNRNKSAIYQSLAAELNLKLNT